MIRKNRRELIELSRKGEQQSIALKIYMIMENEELERLRKDTIDDTSNETTWGGPAGDILTGIRNTEHAPAGRAIWELVQNARDVSWEDEPAVISFVRTAQGLVFSHRGKPFSDISLGSLIKQTSSKVRSDIKTVGKYGTGFLTTHRFGRMIHLKGLLQVVKGRDLYYPFPELKIDRTSDDKDVLKKSLQKQAEKANSWGHKVEDLTCNPHGETEFRYDSITETEKDALREAFEKAPELTPYVLVLNQRYIQQISFTDMLEDSVEKYALGEFIDEPVQEGESYNMRKTCIEITKVGTPSKRTIFYLTSKQSDSRINESVVTVILPIEEVSEGKCRSFLFSPSKTNLYLSLPLIGTENWGVNFLIHSPLFECDNDSRSSLRIVPQGMGFAENDNQRMLDIAFSMVKEWLSNTIDKIEERKFLGKVDFNIASKIPFIEEYYDKQQQAWSAFFKEIPLALNDQQTYTKPSSLYVLDESLATCAESNLELKFALYAVLSSLHPGNVPFESDFIYWCHVVNKWKRPEGEMHIMGVEDVVKAIETLNLNNDGKPVSEDWNNHFYHIEKYLIESGNDALLKYAITPNEQGQLMPIKDLSIPQGLSVDLRNILDDIVPEEKNGFVHTSFRTLGIPNLSTYTEKDAKESLTKRLTELQGKVANKLKAIENDVKASKFDRLDEKWADEISDTAIQAVFRLFTMWIDRTADNMESKFHRLFAEYLDVTDFVEERISKDNFSDCEQMWRTILFEIIYRFNRLSKEEQKEKRDWLKRLLGVLKTYNTTEDYLKRFMLFPNQEGELHFADELISGVGIEPDMIGYYDTLVSAERTSIKKKLADDEFAPFLPKVEVWDNSTVGAKIEEVVCKVQGYPNLQGYDKKATVLQIVKLFSDTDEGKRWASYFKLLPIQKTSILVTFAESDSVFKLLLQPESRLKRMSELAERVDCDSILNIAEKELERRLYDEADMQYKRDLGLYVEKYLVEQLQNLLNDGDTFEAIPDEDSLEDKDVQGGQDIIVYLVHGDEKTPLYYIEIKSRWSTRESVEMSKTQLEVSADKKDNYALCVVDMHDYDKEMVFRGEYPKEFAEIKSRIAVVDKIGERNEILKPHIQYTKTDVHLGGDVKSIVPQDYVKVNHISFDELMDVLVEKVKTYYLNK